jgi:hypothetical protein
MKNITLALMLCAAFGVHLIVAGGDVVSFAECGLI